MTPPGQLLGLQPRRVSVLHKGLSHRHTWFMVTKFKRCFCDLPRRGNGEGEGILLYIGCELWENLVIN